MRNRKTNIFFGIDWILILFYFVLIFIGWLNIYSATVTDEPISLVNFSTEYGKQLIWIGFSIPIILLILMFEAKFYEKYASIIYLISLLKIRRLSGTGTELMSLNMNSTPTSQYCSCKLLTQC